MWFRVIVRLHTQTKLLPIIMLLYLVCLLAVKPNSRYCYYCFTTYVVIVIIVVSVVDFEVGTVCLFVLFDCCSLFGNILYVPFRVVELLVCLVLFILFRVASGLV